MATDPGLVYLSGLLRAGAEPLGTVGRAPRRRASAPPRTTAPLHPSLSYPPALSERAGTEEVSHSLETDAPERATHTTASQTNADDAFAGHTLPANSGETTFAKQPEGFDASNIAPPSTTLDEYIAESVEPPAQASRRTHASFTPSSDTDADVENQSRETETGYVPPSFTTDMHSAAEGYESITPVTSRVTGAAREVRAFSEEEPRSQPHSEEQIWIGETEHTAVATNEGERPPGTPSRLTVEWSPAPLQEGAINSVTSRAEVARAVEDTTTHAAEMAIDAAPVALGTSPVRGLATPHGQPARVFHAPTEEESLRRLESEFAPAVESDVARTGASVRGVADSTAYTLEAHVEQLRALMQTSRAESSGGTAVPAQPTVAGTAKEARADAARRTRESPRVELRPESAAHPSAVLLSKSESRQSVVPESSNRLGATTSRRASATELPGGAPVVSAQKPGAGVATHGQEGKRPPGHVSPSRPAGSPAVTPARDGVAQPRASGTPGGSTAGGARTPKLTINRLDVQVINRPDQSAPARPATPAPASPLQPDPWGAQDRHFLGRFFY